MVKGTGFRKKKKDEEEEMSPDLPTGPIKKAQPLLPRKILKPGIIQPVKNSKQTPKKLADAYLSRFPFLKKLAKTYLGNSTAVVQIFKKAKSGDPIIQEQLKGVLEILLQEVPQNTIRTQSPVQLKQPKRQGTQKTPPFAPPPQTKNP